MQTNTEVVRPCDDDERGAHSERNARRGYIREKKKMTGKARDEEDVGKFRDTDD